MSQTAVVSSNSQELAELPGHNDRQETSGQTNAEEENVQTLPPHDTGRAAWSLLLAAFVFEALLWGSCIDDIGLA